MGIKLNTLSVVASELRGLKSVIIGAHVSPDSDAVGSACALGLGLSQLGTKVIYYFEDQTPEKISAIAEGLTFVHEIPTVEVDAVIVVDTASKKRFGKNGDAVLKLGKQTFNIDHHESNDGWAEKNYINSRASSAAEIIYSLLEELKVNLTKQICNLLFAGLLDDTGCFRYGNASEQAFLCAAGLVRNGATPEFVANSLHFSVPRRLIDLRTKALETLTVHCGGKVSSLFVTQKTLESLGAKSEDTEGLIDEARSVDGALVAFFMREIEGGWKVSLRSKDPKYDVNKLAQIFGGGGHRQASGCVLRESREEAEKVILAEIAKLL